MEPSRWKTEIDTIKHNKAIGWIFFQLYICGLVESKMTGERLNIHVVEHGVGSHDFVEPAACEDDVDQLMNKHGKICNCEQ